MKRAVLLVFCALCFLLILCIEMANIKQFRMIYPGIGLRYVEPISEQSVKQLLEKEEGGIAFWMQTKMLAQSELSQTETTVICYRGDVLLVWPDQYASGQAPSILDKTGCVVSKSLAWQLFGSADVIGFAVKVDGRDYHICGVLDYDKDLLILPAQELTDFTAVEILPDDDAWNDPEAWVSGWLNAKGFPEPAQQLYGRELFGVMQIAVWLPLLSAGVLVASCLIRISRNWNSLQKDASAFAVLLIIALGLPSLLTLVPRWLTPTRWSDFSWWGSIGSVLYARVNQWLSIFPCEKDVLAKWRLLQQALLLLVQVILYGKMKICVICNSLCAKRKKEVLITDE